MSQLDIKDLSLDELKIFLSSIGEKPFRAAQIFQWLYQKYAHHYESMTNIPDPLKAALADAFLFIEPKLNKSVDSSDGTVKFLLELQDHALIETVVIPTEDRVTVCLSSQVGCKFGCKFCASGIKGWARNLTSGEILSQVIYAARYCETKKWRLSHVVFMGVGEPMDNYENVLKAVRLINAKEGMGIGARHITLSTCGIIPGIERLSNENLQVELAVSLHGSNDKIRRELMPVNQRYPLKDLMACCHKYVGNTNRQITFEYIVIPQLTATPETVQELGHLLKGLLCKLNLIPYNGVSEFGYPVPSKKDMLWFQDSLKGAGIHSTIRHSRGSDISAACGQLRHQVTIYNS